MSQINVNTITNVDETGGPVLSGLTTVSGNLNVTGIITATSGIITYYGDGSQLTGLNNLGVFDYDNTSNIYSTITDVSNRTTATHNFLAGTNAGCSITSGSFNNFVGQNAGAANTTGAYNNFFGYFAGCSNTCLLYTSPSPRDVEESRMPSSA